MQRDRSIVLSVAGFDPSAGAGVLADIKTFEASFVYGLAICTANTFQTDQSFLRCDWFKIEDVEQQIEILSNRFSIEVVKIGIVPNFNFLEKVADKILKNNPLCKIIWDPVYKSSTGFQFFDTEWTNEDRNRVLSKLYLLTPNTAESKVFSKCEDALDGGKYLSQFCSVLLKGGHSSVSSSSDILFAHSKEIVFESDRFKTQGKHGSGCVLSASIAAQLSLGCSLEEACVEAKKYISNYLLSSENLLGYHNV